MTGVDFPYSDGETAFVGRVFGPESVEAARLPAVLVFHEAWGLTDHIAKMAAWLAEHGMVAIACDMYGGGFVTDDKAVAGKLIGDLRADPRTMRKRSRAALAAAGVLPGVNPDRIAAVGFCFGGTVALELARDGAPLAAAICVHGGLATLLPAEAGAVAAPILICTGSNDPVVPLTQLADFAGEMDGAGASWRTLMFGGVRHGFTNPDCEAAGVPGAAYDAAADRESRAVILRFLAEKMG